MSEEVANIPNPYMPADVRMVHFVETASSTFIFGVLLFWLRHSNIPDSIYVRNHECSSDQ